MSILNWLADTSGLTAHGFCLFWKPGLMLLNIASDGLTTLAYFSIPIALLYFVRRRRDLPHSWLALPFTGFIVACGAGHALAILTLWVPAYNIEGVVKAITAALSVCTAVLLWKWIPTLLRLPSTREVMLLNAELRAATAASLLVSADLMQAQQQLLLVRDTLHQSQKMHAIGRVAAGVAHDFNNLLLALGGSIELLIDAAKDDPAAEEFGQVALRSVQRGAELTHRLLSFSRQQVLRAQVIPIDALFNDLNHLVGHLFDITIIAKIQLIVGTVAPGLAVRADPAQLEAALMNLAVNARDAMKAGGCLRISAYEASTDPALVEPGRYTVISVADTGEGMTAETLVQACEPFFTTKGLNGTGLGLSMVQGFARQSGGEAHITSVVGEGTTVDLWLPSAAVEPRADVQLAAERSAGRVLVVDDSADALVVVGSFLRLAGFAVTGVTSGDLALAELANGRRFDVIVTDFAMPGMDGLDLIELASKVDPAMAALVITGFSQRELLPALDSTMVLRKPFNRAELVGAVQSLIRVGEPV